MTTTLRIHTEHLMPGKKVVIGEEPHNAQGAGIPGVRGELVYQGQSTTVTVHDGNQIILIEVDADKKEE